MYERLDRSFVPSGVPSSSLGVTRRSFVVDNVEIFLLFSGLSRLPWEARQVT